MCWMPDILIFGNPNYNQKESPPVVLFLFYIGLPGILLLKRPLAFFILFRLNFTNWNNFKNI